MIASENPPTIAQYRVSRLLANEDANGCEDKERLLSLKSRLNLFMQTAPPVAEPLDIEITEELDVDSSDSADDDDTRQQKRKRLIVNLEDESEESDDDDTGAEIEAGLSIEMAVTLGVFEVGNESAVPSDMPVIDHNHQ
jgi:hypothetical protein